MTAATAKALLVDDRRENLMALEAILQGLPVQTVAVESGEAALKQLLVDDFAVLDSHKLDTAIERWKQSLAKNEKEKNKEWFNGIIADYKSERRREYRKEQRQSVNQYSDYPDEE